MATRRKYRDGGRVPVADTSPQSAASADVTPPPTDPNQDALIRALEAHQHAQALQHEPRPAGAQEAPREMTLDEYVGAIPGISEFKRATLKAHPELLNAGRVGQEAYHEALGLGIADDSEQMTAYLLSSVRADAEYRRQRQIEAAKAAAALAPPPRPELSVDREVQRLDDDVASMQAIANATAATPTSIASQVAPPMPRQSTRSIPMAAPVTREVPMASGQRLSPSQIHLTQEERDIARNSFSDPNMSNAEKERMYAMNKVKLARMKANGTYSDQGGR
ncbi:hypothetical protein QMZ05_24620 [Bradyrhizobium sp. INPA03-11B]|uniref:hypothetical protein n=1 Tax=Bradyrhizobium sp. INPA03-11B TaxID=418598 RepID=UPI00338E5C4A